MADNHESRSNVANILGGVALAILPPFMGHLFQTWLSLPVAMTIAFVVIYLGAGIVVGWHRPSWGRFVLIGVFATVGIYCSLRLHLFG
jgi:hypothetical protein